jgi:curved DNA-binding protein
LFEEDIIMKFIDYYKILGVDKNIPQKDVRKAYLKRTKQFHPDLHPDDPKAKAKFQALNEAFDVISDPEKRKKYDQFGEQWKNADAYNDAGFHDGSSFSGRQNDSSSPFEGFDFGSFENSKSGFSDIFEQLFGQHRYSGHVNSGRKDGNGEMNAVVNIDLYTAMLGGEIMIQLSSGVKIKLKVKPETQNNTKVRLRGKGYDRGDGTYGDLIITYNVKLPTNLSERQKDLLRQMRG